MWKIIIKNKSKSGKGGIKIKNKQENNKINNFFSGIFSKKDLISPAYVNMQNPKYFEVDNLYYSSLIVVNYYREQTDLLLKNLIETNINMNISIFYEKQDSYKTIKDLTYHIGNVGVELKESNENRQDIDIASYTYNDAKYIRKEIQVNNEELYFLYIYINIYAEDIKELEYNLNKIEGIAQSKGMQTRRANFRQEECFLAGLPILENKEIIKEAAKRNILTTGLLSTYPFISSTIFDKNGIFIGTNIYNNSLVFIDRYDTNKYKNANICIFGTSGAGKSFYTKLLILRYKLLGIKQYIIDPDREYNKICEKLNGVEIKLGPTSDTYINVLEIRKESIEDGESGYLAIKISKLIGFFNLIFGEMDEEEKALLEEKLIEVYKLKGINFDDKSLLNENFEFKNEKQMPILEDLYYILGQDEKTKKFKIKLIPFVEGSMKFFNNYSNIKLDNELIVADIYDLGEENLKYGMYILIDIFWDAVKKDRKEKKAIYLDEIWRLIGVTSNKYVASFIYKIFKTIRKYSGSGVAITQDISDIFSLDNGTYGKSILNNSSIKTFFALEEENIKILGEYSNLSEKEKIEIKSLKRGECLMFVGEDHILTKIQSSEKEREIIEGSENNDKNNYSNE
jgi:conjugal transfer ATP-binding protein TraC